MRITMVIPDELYDLYKSQAAEKTADGVKDEIKARLVRFKDVPAREKAVILMGDTRRAVEKILQNTIKSPEDLVKQVNTLSSLKIGQIERPFDDSELFRIKEMALFWGKTPEEFILENVDEIIQQFLGRI